MKCYISSAAFKHSLRDATDAAHPSPANASVSISNSNKQVQGYINSPLLQALKQHDSCGSASSGLPAHHQAPGWSPCLIFCLWQHTTRRTHCAVPAPHPRQQVKHREQCFEASGSRLTWHCYEAPFHHECQARPPRPQLSYCCTSDSIHATKLHSSRAARAITDPAAVHLWLQRSHVRFLQSVPWEGPQPFCRPFVAVPFIPSGSWHWCCMQRHRSSTCV